jgi:excisionase family DNA binding protein
METANPLRPPSYRTAAAAALLDARQAAAFLNVPRSTLYELVRSRGLPHVQIGKRGIRFAQSDLEQWIARNTVRSGHGSRTGPTPSSVRDL